MGNNFAPDYVDVSERLVEFREKHPAGCLQPADPAQPYKIERIGDDTYIVVVAAAYRTPDDPRPGIGMAYEVYPGRTPYTRGSELQNAETSAWGRAIVAALAADTKRGIASADEVRNRRAEQDAAAEQPAAPAADPAAVVKRQIVAAAAAVGVATEDIPGHYAGLHNGQPIGEATIGRLRGYLAELRKLASDLPAGEPDPATRDQATAAWLADVSVRIAECTDLAQLRGPLRGEVIARKKQVGEDAAAEVFDAINRRMTELKEGAA